MSNMKNYAERAEQLRAARVEKDKLAAEAKTQAAQKEQQMKESDNQKTRELFTVFRQFKGHKIAGGRASLEAVLQPDTNGNERTCPF